jgi:hypothetical protein
MNKNLLLAFYSLILSFYAQAQSLADFKKMLAAKQFSEANEAITEFLQQPGNEKNADAWYLKGYACNALSRQKEGPAIAEKKEALAAFKQCMAIDAKNKWLSTEEYASVYDLYNSFFEQAKQQYRSENYSDAFDLFCNADSVQQFIYEKKLSYKGFSFSKIDTGLLLNTATCAWLAKRQKDGAAYYARIADARIADPAYLPIYHALVEYYISTRDEIAFRKYLKTGRELFPFDNYWIQAELDMVKAKGMHQALIKSYEEKLAKDPHNFNLNYNFCADLFNVIFKSEERPNDAHELKQKLETGLQKTIGLQQKGVLTELLMARYYYHNAYDLAAQMKEIKGSGAKAGTEKKALQDKIKEHLELSVTNAEKVYQFYDGNPRLKKPEVESLRQATEVLAGVAETNGDKEKTQQYLQKLEEIAKIKPVYQ